MILINSGAYLQGEFASELGLLPPSFLPIGNRRLFEYQSEFLRKFNDKRDIYISLPRSFRLNSFDKLIIDNLGVKIIFTPDNLSLGEAISFCWYSTNKKYENLTLLHGDTLFINSVFRKNNFITIHPNKGFYKRAKLDNKHFSLKKLNNDWSSNFDQVVSGFFNFTNPALFIKCLNRVGNNFIEGVVKYNDKQSLDLVSDGVWLDFGHINSFYHSRSWITTQRSFNDLEIDSHVVKKKSKINPKKIVAEGRWFENIPPDLRLYTPSFLGLNTGTKDYKDAFYKIEYLYLLPLSDLYVFCNLRNDFWENIFKKISIILKNFSNYKPANLSIEFCDNLNKIYLEKTRLRLIEFKQTVNSELYISKLDNLSEIAEETAGFIRTVTFKDIGICHGDLCFSNLLYDNRSEIIKCIDPRGLNIDGDFSIYGDRRYDIAKLYHSIVGFYDFIIAGRHSFNDNFDIEIGTSDLLLNEISYSFNKLVIEPFGYEEKEILAITIHLFISMLPLHSDKPKRQKAFIENTFRLYKKFKLI